MSDVDKKRRKKTEPSIEWKIALHNAMAGPPALDEKYMAWRARKAARKAELYQLKRAKEKQK